MQHEYDQHDDSYQAHEAHEMVDIDPRAAIAETLGDLARRAHPIDPHLAAVLMGIRDELADKCPRRGYFDLRRELRINAHAYQVGRTWRARVTEKIEAIANHPVIQRIRGLDRVGERKEMTR